MRIKALVGALVMAVVIAVVAFAVVSARRLGTQSPPSGPLAADLARRVTNLMEQDFRGLTAPGATPVECTARPFGVRPEGLTRATEATTIYAWVNCRSQAGGSLRAPVAVRLDRPPSVRIPDLGDERERSIRRIFPADVRAALHATGRAEP